MSVDQMSVDQMSVDQMSADQMSVDQMSVHQMFRTVKRSLDNKVNIHWPLFLPKVNSI